jgi:hypothetical protein
MAVKERVLRAQKMENLGAISAYMSNRGLHCGRGLLSHIGLTDWTHRLDFLFAIFQVLNTTLTGEFVVIS